MLRLPIRFKAYLLSLKQYGKRRKAMSAQQIARENTPLLKLNDDFKKIYFLVSNKA